MDEMHRTHIQARCDTKTATEEQRYVGRVGTQIESQREL